MLPAQEDEEKKIYILFFFTFRDQEVALFFSYFKFLFFPHFQYFLNFKIGATELK